MFVNKDKHATNQLEEIKEDLPQKKKQS